MHTCRKLTLAAATLFAVPAYGQLQGHGQLAPVAQSSLADRPTDDSFATVFVGRVLGPDGAPAEGAVVVSSAGGQAVTAADGSFSLEVELAADAERAQLTAVLGSGSGSLVASAQISGLAHWGTTSVGSLRVAQGSGCEPAWLPTFGTLTGVDGTIHALVVFDDGGGPALIAAGHFQVAGGVSAKNIARWDGNRWMALDQRAHCASDDDVISAVAVHNDGSGPALYVGGSFTLSAQGGVVAKSIAKWDGKKWSALAEGISYLQYPGYVSGLGFFDDGSGAALYVTGYFDSAGGVPAANIAQWNGTKWSALGLGLSSSGNALAVYDDGSGLALYVGGVFLTAGGLPVNKLAKWNGVSWAGVGGGVTGNTYCLDVFDDGTGPALYVGGDFTSAGLQSTKNVAKWDGAAWSQLGTGLGTPVRDFEVFDDGTGPNLYACTAAGYSFLESGFVSEWDGVSWQQIGGSASQAEDLCAYDDGSGAMLFAAGFFNASATANDVPANSIAQWDGVAWSPLGRVLGSPSGAIDSLVTFDDGTGSALYVGGDGYSLTYAGKQAIHGIARWDGVAWSKVGDIDAPVMATALAIADDGSGPALYTVGLNKWDGHTWSSLPKPQGFVLAGKSLAGFSDGTTPALYFGGIRVIAFEYNYPYVSEWNGTAWSDLNIPYLAFEGYTRALAVRADSGGREVYAVAQAEYEAWSRIWKYDGTAWSMIGEVSSNDSQNGSVVNLAFLDDGTGSALYACGSFDALGPVPTNCIAKWDGAAWSAPTANVVGEVTAMTVFDDGTGSALFAAGKFSFSTDSPKHQVAKWDGNHWSTLGSGTEGIVKCFAPFGTGPAAGLYAGGSFSKIADMGDARIARWGGCAPPLGAWKDSAPGRAGAGGVPRLAGSGRLAPGVHGALTLSGAQSAAPAVLFVSAGSTPQLFKGGTLSAVPVLYSVSLMTDVTGEITIPWTTPADVPAGTALCVQFAVRDTTTAGGVALSNALRADVP